MLPGTVEFYPWEYQTVGALMASCDCSIIPLEQTAWCWAKSDNKAASMMSMGLPLVTEDVKCYDEVAPHALVAYQAEDWAQQLERIVTDPALRRQLGKQGQEWALEERGIEHVTDLLLERLGV